MNSLAVGHGSDRRSLPMTGQTGHGVRIFLVKTARIQAGRGFCSDRGYGGSAQMMLYWRQQKAIRDGGIRHEQASPIPRNR